MKIGKISESVLKRTIIKEIKYKRKDVKKGAAIGNDATVFKGCDRDMASSMATYAGEIVFAAKRAFAGAINSLSAKGAEPVAVMVSVLMPDTVKESHLRNMMVMLDSLGAGINVQIAGGHTETSDKISVPVVTINAFGYMYQPYDDKENKTKNHIGLDVIMVGETALEGTAVLAVEKEEALRERFTASYINKAKAFSDEILTASEAAVAMQHGAIAMHDISKGGVFGALWELGEYLKCGVNINLKAIPIRQETVELCEYFDINPYFLNGAGGLLIVAPNGEAVVEALKECKKTAVVIGCTTEGHDKAIINNDERRFLEPPKAGNGMYV